MRIAVPPTDPILSDQRILTAFEDAVRHIRSRPARGKQAIILSGICWASCAEKSLKTAMS